MLGLCGCLAVAMASPQWVTDYIDAQIFKSLGTNEIDSVSFHVGTNTVTKTNVQPGDTLLILLSGPNYPDPESTNKYSMNWVGYIKMQIPETNSPPTVIVDP